MSVDSEAIFASEYARKKKEVEITRIAHENAVQELKLHRLYYRIGVSNRMLIDLDNRIDQYEKNIEIQEKMALIYAPTSPLSDIGDDFDSYLVMPNKDQERQDNEGKSDVKQRDEEEKRQVQEGRGKQEKKLHGKKRVRSEDLDALIFV
jgi:hypothetical protein